MPKMKRLLTSLYMHVLQKKGAGEDLANFQKDQDEATHAKEMKDQYTLWRAVSTSLLKMLGSLQLNYKSMPWSSILQKMVAGRSTDPLKRLCFERIGDLDLGDDDILVTGVNNKPLLTRRAADKDDNSDQALGLPAAVIKKKARIIPPSGGGLKTGREKGKGRAPPKSMPYIGDDNDVDIKDSAIMNPVGDLGVASSSLLTMPPDAALFPGAPPLSGHVGPSASDFSTPAPPVPSMPENTSGSSSFFEWDQILHDISIQNLAWQLTQPSTLPWDDTNFSLLVPKDNCS
ncbi:hypothetical protein BS47DRAFT_1368099 [Hydnum rufescens UP504]|uniref:Uncharacterized protein n=1 Tax=Hydnum rufescens UP504 TaxID=1448309 RepID=A0A9P6AGZ2_9AGAM|nr:hypothetical protein BS47DRAFT_1368099 [Hydnum rufescens UP504]